MTFSTFIESVGAFRLAAMLGLAPTTIYRWRDLESVPRPEIALKLILVSSGVLTWEKIYLPYLRKRNEGKISIKSSETISQEFSF